MEALLGLHLGTLDYAIAYTANDQPKPGSPAANAGIEAGDAITAINGSLLMRSSDFTTIISSMAPGTTVYLTTWRGGEWFQRTLILGSSKCPDPTARLRTNKISTDPYNQ